MLNKLKDDIQESEESTERKRSNSQRKYQKAPDIITQVKPNSFVQPLNPHQSAFTPTNRSNKLNSQKLLLPPKPHNLKKKTLILDLDETLVHSSFTPFEKNDIVLNVDFEGVMYNIYVLVRPEAELFIKTVAKFFELVIFTASISKYASPLLDILDKDKNIKYRLYREQCTFINGIYIKDLKKCNRSLKDLIIVDNSPIAYTFDSDNGLPIKTWIEDPDDRELMKLVPILEFLSKTKDVRKFIEQFVYNNKILFEEANEIIKMKELMDLKNNNDMNDNNKKYITGLDDKFVHNIKSINKNNINFEDDSSLIKEEKNIDKEKEDEKDIKNNNNKMEEINILNINNNINEKNNFINPEIQINERNEDLKLNNFNEKGFNTTKNSIKFSNNLNFNENNINIKENNTNINNTNIEINISNNKINIGNNKHNNLKQNKKNIFRFKATDQQPPNKIGLNNIIYSNKFDPSLPLTLLLSNISKGLFTPKSSSQEKTKKEKFKNNNTNNTKKKMEKNNLNNIKPFLLKDINNENCTTNNKKIKYINLIEKYKGKNKPPNNLMKTASGGFNNKTKKMKGHYSMKNIIHKPHNLRVSSSISSYHGYVPGNSNIPNNAVKEKTGTSYYKVTKSKSTDNFLVFNTNKNYPKTPKEAYRQKMVINNKKIINFMDNFNMTKTLNNKNNNYSKNNFGGIFQNKKNNKKKKK
jgi:RNA polymerase II subunit A small phosphatase-like protein